MKYPSPATLAKYGLSEFDYRMMYEAQGGVCAICQKEKDKALFVDHEHVKGWVKLPPEQRKTYVRGLVCNYCNYRLLFNGMNLDKARNLVKYLEDYAIRQKRAI
jgi:DNA-directed RNA polymerase subunit RPC12/RpoP